MGEWREERGRRGEKSPKSGADKRNITEQLGTDAVVHSGPGVGAALSRANELEESKKTKTWRKGKEGVREGRSR